MQSLKIIQYLKLPPVIIIFVKYQRCNVVGTCEAQLSRDNLLGRKKFIQARLFVILKELCFQIKKVFSFSEDSVLLTIWTQSINDLKQLLTWKYILKL